MAPCCHEWTRPGTTRRHAGRRRFARTRRCPPVGWHRAAPHRRGTRLQLLLRKGRREARRRSRSRRGEHRTWNAVPGAALPSLPYPVAGDALLSGIVVDGDGQPIAGATAHVCWDAFALAGERLDIRNVIPTTTTDGDGRFTVCGLPSDMPLSCGRRSARQRARSSKRERAAGSRPLRRPSDDRPPDRARAVNAEDTDPAPRSGGRRPATSFDENAPRRGYSSHR